MFLIRTAFWVSVVIMLMPTGEPDVTQTGSINPGTDVSAFEAISAAQQTVSDLAGFCDRNPDACQTGSDALKAFGKKAQYSAKKIYEYISETGDADVDTLLPDDREAPWQGPDAQG